MDETRTENWFQHHIADLPLAEFDLGGVLYHANYFHLFEQAREAMLRAAGVPYPSLVENQQHLAIVESHQNFNAPVRYGQPLSISVSIRELRRSNLIFDYKIGAAGSNGSYTSVHTAWTKAVFVQIVDGNFQILPLPQVLREFFEQYQSE